MIWFIERYPFDSASLIDAGAATFDRRREHAWPPEVPAVPVSWARPYAAFRKEMEIGPETAEAARGELARFLDPVLVGERGLRSEPGGTWASIRIPANPANPG